MFLSQTFSAKTPFSGLLATSTNKFGSVEPPLELGLGLGLVGFSPPKCLHRSAADRPRVRGHRSPGPAGAADAAPRPGSDALAGLLWRNWTPVVCLEYLRFHTCRNFSAIFRNFPQNTLVSIQNPIRHVHFENAGGFCVIWTPQMLQRSPKENYFPTHFTRNFPN